MIYNISKNIFFISLVLLFFITHDTVNAESDSIDIKLIVFENTSIIEFTNNGIKPINTIKLWLVDDSFLSFKTESGWTGKKNNQGTLTFSFSTPFELDQKVKFGIKTSKSNSQINWNIMDINGTSIEINTTQSLADQSILDKNFIYTGFLENSKFKIIPESPRAASPIRITGTDFMKSFNQIYYSFSPGIADLERESPLFKEVVKISLTPLLSSLSILNHVDMDSESTVLGWY